MFWYMTSQRVLVGVLVAWLYYRFDMWLGFGSLGILGVIVPIIAVRHVYGLYHQLEDSGQELLQVMVKAIEARDPYTSGHSVRVSEMSTSLSVELGFQRGKLSKLRLRHCFMTLARSTRNLRHYLERKGA